MLGKIIISGRWAMSKQQVKSHQEVIPIKYCKLGPPPRNRSQSQLGKKVSIFIIVLHFIYILRVSFDMLGKIIISGRWAMSKQQVKSHQEVIPIKYCKLGPPPRNRSQSQLGKKVSIFIIVLHFIYIWRVSFDMLGKIIISGSWAMSKQQVKSHQEVIPIKYCKLGPPPRNRRQSQLGKKVSIFISVLHFIYIWKVSFDIDNSFTAFACKSLST